VSFLPDPGSRLQSEKRLTGSANLSVFIFFFLLTIHLKRSKSILKTEWGPINSDYETITSYFSLGRPINFSNLFHPWRVWADLSFQVPTMPNGRKRTIAT
jgi:hypothetical protein